MFLLLLLTNFAYAGQWAHFQNNTVFWDKSVCEAEHAPCYDTSECQIHRCSLVDGQVVEDPAKVAQIEYEKTLLEQKAQRAEAAKNVIKTTNLDAVDTVPELKSLLKAVIDAQEDP